MVEAVTSGPLFSVRGMYKAFGAVQALRGVDLEVSSGDVLAVIGENGAGKSTLMKIISGAHRPDAGSMTLNGRAYRPQSPAEGRAAGIAMIYQELTLAPHLTVQENITLGLECGWCAKSESQLISVKRALSLLGHEDIDPHAQAGSLSIGRQQIVEIARALYADAQVVVMDEPTSSLSGHDIEALFTVIRRLKDAGKTVIYISHFLEEIQKICTRYAVLRDGQSVAMGSVSGTPMDRLIEAMIGRSVGEVFEPHRRVPGELLLRVQNLRGQMLPCDVSLDLRRGEILGIAGLVGSGRTELLRLLYGLEKPVSGTIDCSVRDVGFQRGGRQAVDLLSEDRKKEGLATAMTVSENISLSSLDRYGRLGVLSLRREQLATGEVAKELGVKCQSVLDPVDSLSGGNQQKVALARLVHQDADILLLDEPTRGVDIGSKVEIYRLIHRMAQQGKAIIMVSSYLPELFGMCDRLGVMYKGRLSSVRDVHSWTHGMVMRFATLGTLEGVAA